MSVTLYVLVAVAQGTTNGLTFAPGYTREECLQQYHGPNWFFRLSDGSLRVVRKIPSGAECQRYIGAFKSDVPAACRQLAMPASSACPVVCRTPEPTPRPPPPPAAKPEPEPKPDPAAFREVTVGPTDLRAADRPYLEPRVIPPKPMRTARRRQQQRYAAFDPFGAIVSLLTPRDW
jgi:hypothetical protein